MVFDMIVERDIHLKSLDRKGTFIYAIKNGEEMSSILKALGGYKALVCFTDGYWSYYFSSEEIIPNGQQKKTDWGYCGRQERNETLRFFDKNEHDLDLSDFESDSWAECAAVLIVEEQKIEGKWVASQRDFPLATL